jgi:hypothetical protein
MKLYLCWPAYLYLVTYIITFSISIVYYQIYKKTLCSTQKIDNQDIESCILDCTTFSYFYNGIKVIIFTIILNLLCYYGSYVGTFIAILIYLFSLIPLFYTIKILSDKTSKQKDLKC